jgi:hypothetical protein
MRAGIVRAVVGTIPVLIVVDSTAAGVLTAQPFIGITHHQFVKGLNEPANSPTFNWPRELVVNVLEINMSAAGIAFRVQPGNGADPGEVTRMTTRGFVNSIGAQIGINGDFFAVNPPYPPQNGQFFTDVTHIAASNGEVYSPNAGGDPTFNVSASNEPRILRGRAAGTTTNTNNVPLYNAIAGNQRILNSGTISAPDDDYTNTLNPHTAVAVSQDRSRVFLMTVDGRQNDYSEGMRTTEMAELFLTLGGWDAINLDGGGSTTMVMDDDGDALADARIINSPSDQSTPQAPGVERLVANNLAVFAMPNPNYTPLPMPPRPPASPALPVIGQQVILDDFEGSRGRFSSAPNASGSSANVAATSASAVDPNHSHTGNDSLRVDIVNTNATPARMQLRLLSGGGSPSANTVNGEALGPQGYVGYFMRVEPGNDPLFASILIDDGTTGANGLERGSFLPIVADGEWHLYQWDLGDAAMWENFASGNGAVGGPNAFIDAIYLSSAAGTSGGTNWSGTVWIDTVAYNPDGTLDNLIPEPSVAGLFCFAALAIRRRKR